MGEDVSGRENEKGVACPLCGNRQGAAVFRTDRRVWLRCPACDLIHIPPGDWLAAEEEKARYDQHRNDPGDPGYRNFLDRLFTPLSQRLQPGAEGLDFGCGPGPALAQMFCEAGFPCATYDPFYADHPGALDRTYDFITCTEAAEHFHRPLDEFFLMFGRVNPGGWLGVMTQLHDQAALPFSRWFYKDDPTHTCIFSTKTFLWLGAALGTDPQFFPHGVVLFRKSLSV